MDTKPSITLLLNLPERPDPIEVTIAEAIGLYEELGELFGACDTLAEKISSDPLFPRNLDETEARIRRTSDEIRETLAELCEQNRAPSTPPFRGLTFDETLDVPAAGGRRRRVAMPKPYSDALLTLTCNGQEFVLRLDGEGDVGLPFDAEDKDDPRFTVGRRLRLAVTGAVEQVVRAPARAAPIVFEEVWF